MKSENDILQALADRADEENREKDAQIGKSYQEKQGKKKKGKAKEKSGESNELTPQNEPENLSRDTGEMAPSTEPSLPLPEISEDAAEDKETSNPFDALAGEMKEKGEPLTKPERKESGSKFKGMKSKELGEEVTKEHAEKIISGKKGGHRKTVIVRTQIIEKDDASGDLPKDAAPKPKKEEKLPPSLSLVRSDTGEVYELDTDLSVGRSDDNDIVIPNPEGHYVSSHHAEIQIQGKDIFLKDLSSTNGTYVNDRKIGSKRIRLGDVVEFADIKFDVVEG